MPKMRSNRVRFYGLDGDKIGSTVELYLIEDNIETLGTFSHRVSSTLEGIRDDVLRNNGTVILCAGDSVLFYGDFSIAWCEKLIERFKSVTGRTASMGIGDTAPEAYLALKLAKARGGNKVVYYSLSAR